MTDSLNARLRRLEQRRATGTGETLANGPVFKEQMRGMLASMLPPSFVDWFDWWHPGPDDLYPPPFPAEMPEAVREHFAQLVEMDLCTFPRPLSEIPQHVQEFLPEDLVAHLRQQFPTDDELAAIGDYQWEEMRGGFTLPHFEELSERRARLRAAVFHGQQSEGQEKTGSPT